MTKSIERLLFAFVGVVVIVVAIFASSKGMRDNFSTTISLLFNKYENHPTTPRYINNEGSGKLSVPTTTQNDTGSTTNQSVQNNSNASGSDTDIATSTRHGVFSGNAPYRNDEFGFGFTIPENWQVKENLYAGPYSYFNLSLVPLDKKANYIDALLINIVKPEFIEMSYRTMRPADTPITVDGVNGVKYEYAFERSNSIDYIIFRPQKAFIIGYQKEYSDIFNQVISSFKFLKEVEE